MALTSSTDRDVAALGAVPGRACEMASSGWAKAARGDLARASLRIACTYSKLVVAQVRTTFKSNLHQLASCALSFKGNEERGERAGPTGQGA